MSEQIEIDQITETLLRFKIKSKGFRIVLKDELNVNSNKKYAQFVHQILGDSGYHVDNDTDLHKWNYIKGEKEQIARLKERLLYLS